MENASKALIIAGAILISIVLVSVGVLVVNQLNPDEAVSQMSQQEIDSFNSKFVSSAGKTVRGTVVRSLISNVITSNGANEDTLDITVTDGTNTGSDSATLSKIRNNINTSHSYAVLLGYATDGRVNAIGIGAAGTEPELPTTTTPQ